MTSHHHHTERIKIICSSDATHLKIDISLEATLQQLKNEISIQKEIEPKFQRLFHFGRELINSRRSLSTLGIGKFNSYVLHLHSSQPKDHIFKPTATREKSGTKVDKVGGVVCIDSATTASNDIISSLSNRNRKRKRNRNQETIDLSCTSATSSSSSTISSKDNNNNGRSLQRNRNINATSASARSSTKTTTSRSNNVQVVVDLLNDSDDDDDDDGDGDGDDEIEVVEVKATSSNKRSSR